MEYVFFVKMTVQKVETTFKVLYGIIFISAEAFLGAINL